MSYDLAIARLRIAARDVSCADPFADSKTVWTFAAVILNNSVDWPRDFTDMIWNCHNNHPYI